MVPILSLRSLNWGRVRIRGGTGGGRCGGRSMAVVGAITARAGDLASRTSPPGGIGCGPDLGLPVMCRHVGLCGFSPDLGDELLQHGGGHLGLALLPLRRSLGSRSSSLPRPRLLLRPCPSRPAFPASPFPLPFFSRRLLRASRARLLGASGSGFGGSGLTGVGGAGRLGRGRLFQAWGLGGGLGGALGRRRGLSFGSPGGRAALRKARRPRSARRTAWTMTRRDEYTAERLRPGRRAPPARGALTGQAARGAHALHLALEGSSPGTPS